MEAILVRKMYVVLGRYLTLENYFVYNYSLFSDGQVLIET